MDFVIAAGMPQRQNGSVPVRLQRPRAGDCTPGAFTNVAALSAHAGNSRFLIFWTHFLESYKYE